MKISNLESKLKKLNIELGWASDVDSFFTMNGKKIKVHKYNNEVLLYSHEQLSGFTNEGAYYEGNYNTFEKFNDVVKFSNN